MNQYKTAILVSSYHFKLEFGQYSIGKAAGILHFAITCLKARFPEHFISSNLDDYLIVSCCRLHCPESNPNKYEQYHKKVLKLFNSHMKGIEFVVCLGLPSIWLLEKSNYKGPVLRGSNLNWMSINQTYGSFELTSYEQKIDKISQWVDSFELIER